MKGLDVVRTHEQLSEYLLCQVCEQLCGKTEGGMRKLLTTRSGSTALTKSLGPSVARADLFDARPVPAAVSATLGRFAAIMVWRASVSTKAKQCSLGAKYEEQFRVYIEQSGTAWPATSACFVWLHEGNILNDAFAPPVTNRSGPCHFHRFPLCGLEFLVFVGGQLPDHVQRLHILQANNIALATPGQLDQWLLEPLARATPRGILARKAEPPDHARR